MKKENFLLLLRVFSVLFVINICIYFSISFYHLTVDFSKWSENTRATFAIIFGISITIGSLVIYSIVQDFITSQNKK